MYYYFIYISVFFKSNFINFFYLAFEEITNIPFSDKQFIGIKKFFRNIDKKKNNLIFHNNEEEKNKIKIIDEIINVFSEQFSSIRKEEILEALHKNSFDMWDSFLYLSDPNFFKSNFKLIIYK